MYLSYILFFPNLVKHRSSIKTFGGFLLFYSAFYPQQILGHIIINRNAEVVHGQRKVGYPCRGGLRLCGALAET